MSPSTEAIHLVFRQSATAAPTCETGNDYDGHLGLRVAAIFIIWITSSIGGIFPVYAKRQQGSNLPEWPFFIAKYFGSGVIVATAFIHLLSPAEDALRNPCLTGPITEYSWAEGIILMTIFVLFFVELMVMRFGNFEESHDHSPSHGHSHQHSPLETEVKQRDKSPSSNDSFELPSTSKEEVSSLTVAPHLRSRAQLHTTHQPGEDHLSHVRSHTDIEESADLLSLEDYQAQLTAIFILEFGIVFHSVFIGLTLAVAGAEFNTLFVVLIFHQTFEGLGLGSRLAVTPWPKSKRFTPYVLGLIYGLSTPLAIAVGLGVRKTYPPGSATTLIVNGVFDSISAGILIYTGLVELMAHEFMFSQSMRRARISVVLTAFGLMCLGAGLMALLGKWA